MENHRAFYQLSRAWYGAQLKTESYTEEVMFDYYGPSGGTSGEMAMRWYDLGRENTPRLEAFCDAWRVLAEMQDVLAALANADGKDITPDEFCHLLLQLGFVDKTDVDDERREQLDAKLRAVIEQAKQERS